MAPNLVYARMGERSKQMKKRLLSISTTVLLVSMLIVTTVFAATIDPVNRTVSTGNFFVDWSESNPEEIVELRWMGSPNLTNSAGPVCGGNLEYFGNSWVSENEGTPSFFFGSLVGWGTTGAWSTPNSKKVNVDSISSGCFGSANISVTTNYQFFDSGAVANRIKVQRQFEFGATPYVHDVRPYIPRLYPQDGFTQVLHPNASGTGLVTETTDGCDFGCAVTDWNGTWFAIHNPTTGLGMIVRRDSSTPADLWVDKDDASFTNSSSVLLLQPPGGFTGTVNETEFLCFYDNTIWIPSTTLPPGC
jgi:hypothetical protein